MPIRPAPAGARLALGLGEQRGGDPAAAGVARARTAAPKRAVPPARRQQPAGADDRAAVVDGDELDRLVVAAVALGRERHALLAGEDRLAQRERGLELGAVAHAADLDRRRGRVTR